MSRKRYPLRVARTAHGIRAQDLRTLARTAWWARRWIAALEAMRLGARFGRGRQYAVSGQVTDLALEGPHVEAVVAGSRPAPYRVTLDFTAVRGDAAARVADALAREPMRLARLLTDDLPTEVEELLRAEGVPLFPQAAPLRQNVDGRPVYDVTMRCTCPDWARPCKHMAAVLLLLGEEIARHPLALLALRGVEVEGEMKGERGKVKDEGGKGKGEGEDVGEAGNGEREISADDGQPPSAHLSPFTFPLSPSFHLSLLRRLGAVPYWRGSARCVDALAKLYGRAQPVALAAAEGKSIDLRG